MKKSIRILSLLMAFAMLIGSFSVMGNAYQAYKDSAVSYNDVDAPEFTTEQYASMGLDEVDRMLLKEKIELDIYIGKLDLGSIDTTLASVVSLVASVQNLLPLLGDASALPTYIEPIKTVRRSTHTDVQVIQALFNFISELAPLVEKYVKGGVSLGILNSFVADFIFNVRELAIGLLFGLTEEGKAMGELDENGEPEGYDYFDDGIDGLPAAYKKTDAEGKVVTSDTAGITLLQHLINDLVLGEWKLLDDYFNDPYSVVNYNFYGFKTDPEYAVEKDAEGNVIKYESKPDTENYDYYGWVHPKDWVTVGLGGYKRVPAGTAAPAADYSNLDINKGIKGYDFIETLLRAAYNNLLIPVLNRDTVRWVREDLCGITYLDKYAKRTLFGDDPATDVVEGAGDVPGVWYNNPDYEPSYAGEKFDLAELQEESVFARLFDIENTIQLPLSGEIPAGTTLIDNFNNLVGEVLHAAAVESYTEPGGTTYTWTWEEGDNSKLLTNICDVLRFVLQVTREEFFGSTAFKEEFPTGAEIGAMNDQAAVSMVLRGILNSSVDYIYVEPEYNTLVDVAYRAVEQLAYQDIPQFTYTKPVRSSYASDEAYYEGVIDKMLDILFDIAVYNLNQGMDMDPASGNDPVNFGGLLQYQGDNGGYETNLVKIAAWAFEDYAPLLSVYDQLVLPTVTNPTAADADKVWQDIDTIINALIPIKAGSDPFISNEIASQSIVSKSFIFDYILKPVYTLDATNLAEIFAKNPNGAFAKLDGVAIIISILDNVFDLLFPGVFQEKGTIDEIVNNTLLGDMVSDLLKTLGTESFTSSTGATIEGRADDIILVGLPLVCMLLGLSDDQAFEEMEIYLPETIAATGDIPTFEVINGSSGINTFHTAADGTTKQDKLYEYKIKEVILNQYNAAGTQVYTLNYSGLNEDQTLSGGDVVNVSLSGTRNVGDIIEFTVNYFIYGEDGTTITDDVLSKTVYSYVGNTDEDDDNITLEEEISGRKIQYSDSIYLSAGDGLDDIEGYSIRIRDDDSGSASTASVTSVAMTSSDPSDYKDLYPFVVKNDGRDEDKKITESMTGEEGIYFLYPFVVKEKAAGEYYVRYEDIYQVDEETGELVLDENEEPIVVDNNGGVKDGQYNVETKVNVAGTEKTLTTAIHLYDDFGLESMFNRAVAENRQESNYRMDIGAGAAAGLWINYKTALMNAARLALMPKEGTTFAAAIKATKAGYANRYEELADELEAAIEALEPYTKDSGITGLKNAIDGVSGINYTTEEKTATTADGQTYTIITKEDIEYYDDAYVHFGMRDYVPHTYNRYKDARKLAEGIINSQEFFAPENPADREYYVPSAEEVQQYNEAMAEYAERRLNLEPVNAIEATYAIHMINLTSSRLIRLEGDTNKLQIVYNTYANEDTSTGYFVGDSKEDYNNAVAFAAEVLAKDDPRPSEINTATTKLVKAWKNLDVSGDYSKVDSALAAAKATVDANGLDATKQFIYSEETYKAFSDAYLEALRASETKPYGNTEEEQKTIDQIAQDLVDAQAALTLAGEEGGDEPVIALKTEPTGLYRDYQYEYFNFVPRVSEGAYNHTSFNATLDDDTPVDGYLVGFGVGCLDEDSIMQAFNLENCTYEVIPTENGYGSGTAIKFFDDNGDVVKAYVVVVIGDTTGDDEHTAEDGIEIAMSENYIVDWVWNGEHEEYKLAAGDITNDGMTDSTDIICLDYLDAYVGNVNQEVSPDGDSSYLEYGFNG
ncbi:MAG: hypothetical protein IJE74_05840 [Clostridia bacterium]|nr:hypothetical protein [Clostridia bacterium]